MGCFPKSEMLYSNNLSPGICRGFCVLLGWPSAEQHGDNMKAKLHMNIDPQLKEALQVLAAKDNRNLTNFIEVQLRHLVETAIVRKNTEVLTKGN